MHCQETARHNEISAPSSFPLAIAAEGEKVLMPGEQIEGAGASAKPILLRIACDLCKDEDNGPVCMQACPYGVLSMEG